MAGSVDGAPREAKSLPPATGDRYALERARLDGGAFSVMRQHTRLIANLGNRSRCCGRRSGFAVVAGATAYGGASGESRDASPLTSSPLHGRKRSNIRGNGIVSRT